MSLDRPIQRNAQDGNWPRPACGSLQPSADGHSRSPSSFTVSPGCRLRSVLIREDLLQGDPKQGVAHWLNRVVVLTGLLLRPIPVLSSPPQQPIRFASVGLASMCSERGQIQRRSEKASIACPKPRTSGETGRGKEVKIDIADPDAEQPLVLKKRHHLEMARRRYLGQGL
jgi:hypothetical protein